MTRRILPFACAAMIIASCGGGSAVSPTTATPTAGSSSTTVVPATSTTAAAFDPTTTTTAAPTTTATQAAEAAVTPELMSIRAALADSAEVSSGRMKGLFEIVGSDSSQGSVTFSIPFSGAFDNRSGDFSFSMDMSGLAALGADEVTPDLAAMFGEMEVRQIGDTAYIKYPFINAFLGATTPWIAAPADSNAIDGFTMASPSNPVEIFQSFEEADAAVDDLGPETVNGESSTHYRVTFDTEKLLAQATPKERARLEREGVVPIGSLPMDLWISDGGLVVRFVMDIDGSTLVVDEREGFEHMTMRYDLYDLGGEVVIEVPPASEVSSVDDLQTMFGIEPPA